MHTLEDLREGRLSGARRVSLRLGLERFPEELYALADSLEELDLSGNHLSTLPKDFGRLSRLKAAFFYGNAFEDLPPQLADCPSLDVYGFRDNAITRLDGHWWPERLRWLILTGNRLTELPSEIGRLRRLQKLMLAGNRLEALPDAMAGCSGLELVRLASNRLADLPGWLVELPRLAWLAYAGNPLPEALTGPARRPEVPRVPHSDLAVGEMLGEGTSGLIHRARWRRPDGEHFVAVKVFKGELTSDGTPDDELLASMVAGAHEHLVSVLGEVKDHPEGKKALVLDLIPHSHEIMAGPPSLATCTRDTYPPERRFTVEVTRRLALGVASAAAHLHARGVLHGDLYPHNTLLDAHGYCKVSDFGAASFYERTHPRFGAGLERLEVRAFGCLLEDALERLEEGGEETAEREKLESLRQACMSPATGERPSFEEIGEALAG